jgi:hypothetical protein
MSLVDAIRGNSWISTFCCISHLPASTATSLIGLHIYRIDLTHLSTSWHPHVSPFPFCPSMKSDHDFLLFFFLLVSLIILCAPRRTKSTRCSRISPSLSRTLKLFLLKRCEPYNWIELFPLDITGVLLLVCRIFFQVFLREREGVNWFGSPLYEAHFSDWGTHSSESYLRPP